MVPTFIPVAFQTVAPMQVSLGQLNWGVPMNASSVNLNSSHVVASTHQTQSNMSLIVGNIQGSNVPLISSVQIIQPVITQHFENEISNMGCIMPQVSSPCG